MPKSDDKFSQLLNYHKATNWLDLRIENEFNIETLQVLSLLRGKLMGLLEYAHWKDGEQLVGSCGTTLNQATYRVMSAYIGNDSEKKTKGFDAFASVQFYMTDEGEISIYQSGAKVGDPCMVLEIKNDSQKLGFLSALVAMFEGNDEEFEVKGWQTHIKDE